MSVRTPMFAWIKRRCYNPELIIWSVGLVVLAALPPGTNRHYTFCIPTLLGFDGCWGCGIGESIGYCLRGNIASSIEAHLLGPFAVLVICGRIVSLLFGTKHF